MIMALIEKGERFFAFKEGKRSARVSIIAAFNQEKLIAPLTFEGSCNRVIFEKWLSTWLKKIGKRKAAAL